PPSVGKPDEADRQHLREVSLASGRPVFFLGFDADARSYVEAAARDGVQLYNLLRAIPFNPRITLTNTTFFKNLAVWDVTMDLPMAERLAALADPARRPALREAALQRQRRRPGVRGRVSPWPGIVVRRVALDKSRPLEGRRLADLAAERGTHVADAMLDLAVEERLETVFELQTRSPEEDVELVEMVKTGHALPSQSDAGAHLNTNFCTAGESSYVLGQWVRERQLLTLEDAVRRLTFQPACVVDLGRAGPEYPRRTGMARDVLGSRWFALVLILLARVSMAVQFQSIAPVGPLLVADLTLSYAELGLLIGLYLLPGAALALPGGLLGQRFGNRPVVLSALGLMVGGGLVTAASHSLWMAGAGRLVSGAGWVLLTLVVAKMTGGWFAGREISTAMGIMLT